MSTERKYIQVDNYVVKCRAYPTPEQAKLIDDILMGLRIAYNITAYEISQGNPLLTKADKKNEDVRWPNFSACMKKEWLDHLRKEHELIRIVPAGALSSSVYGRETWIKKHRKERYVIGKRNSNTVKHELRHMDYMGIE